MTSDSCQLAFSIEGGDGGKTMKIQIALFILKFIITMVYYIYTIVTILYYYTTI